MNRNSVLQLVPSPELRDSLRRNNFDLVRLLLAFTVVFVHCYDLSGSSQLGIFGAVLNAQMAVQGFFVISGFLIIASYERSRTLKEYCSKRARRILPGYWLATLVCVALAACFNPHLNPIPFLLANVTFLNFLHPGIAGVFTHNPGNSAMDGALWTIKIEVMFYAAVPVLVWACRRLGTLRVLSAITLLSVAFRMFADSSGHEKLGQQLPGQMSFFCLGALAYYYFPFLQKHAKALVIVSGLCYLAYLYTGFFPLRPVFVAILTLVTSLFLPQIKGPTQWGDFSYGTYVLHWPLIQTAVALGLFARSPWLGLGAVLITVAIVATFSWLFVERRWLSRRTDHGAARQPTRPAELAKETLVLSGAVEAQASANPTA